MNSITTFLDEYLTRTGRTSINPVEANALLAKVGILRDSKDRPGKPLRDLLRKGNLPHAFQSEGKGSPWIIPFSTKGSSLVSNYPIGKPEQVKKVSKIKKAKATEKAVDIKQLKKQLEKSRLKFKPVRVKYLLIAEAPPNGLERFFYYDNVRQHDYLFLGVAQVLYPNLKEQFLLSGRSSEIKNSILEKFQQEGFYLLDLSEVPLSLLNTNLQSQLPILVEKIKAVANNTTHIILIKATVYDTAFQYLKQRFRNVVDQRITFPGQGGQRKFQDELKQALRIVPYL